MLDSLSNEELEFVKAIESYKQENRKLFLSWTEVLKIVKELGYRRHKGRPRPEKDAGKSPAKKKAGAKETEARGKDQPESTGEPAPDGEKPAETARKPGATRAKESEPAR